MNWWAIVGLGFGIAWGLVVGQAIFWARGYRRGFQDGIQNEQDFRATLSVARDRKGPPKQDPRRIPPSGMAAWLVGPLVAMSLQGCVGPEPACEPLECPVCDPEDCSAACLGDRFPLGICIEDACECVDDQHGGTVPAGEGS